MSISTSLVLNILHNKRKSLIIHFSLIRFVCVYGIESIAFKKQLHHSGYIGTMNIVIVVIVLVIIIIESTVVFVSSVAVIVFINVDNYCHYAYCCVLP